MINKVVVSCLAASVLIFALSGCNNSDSATDAKGTTTNATSSATSASTTAGGMTAEQKTQMQQSQQADGAARSANAARNTK